VSAIQVHPEVREALRRGRPVVALETAVATAGLPAAPLGRAPACDAPGWNPEAHCGLETLALMQRLVRAGGAVPATVGVLDGTLRIGMDGPDLARLAELGASIKASARDLAVVMAAGGAAGTTVSATLVACRHPLVRIRVMATGGIGGVHRRWTNRLDVSADLLGLATSPVCVVASGVKSVLDVAATLEALEAIGVPVLAFGTPLMPLFYSRGRETLPAPRRVDDIGAIVEICRAHWDALGSSTSVLLANPIAERYAIDAAEVDRIVAEFDDDAVAGARTPLLLAEVQERTGGRALDANIALLADNARLAARVATGLLKDAGPDPASGSLTQPATGDGR